MTAIMIEESQSLLHQGGAVTLRVTVRNGDMDGETSQSLLHQGGAVTNKQSSTTGAQ